jgi:hypothetical protein
MVDAMTTPSLTRAPTRADKAAALERWADEVSTDELVTVDTSALRALAELAEQREALEGELTRAVLEARRAHRSWSEIGAMLGVSKQAAQRKYSRRISAA